MSDRNSQYTIILFAHLLNVNALGLALGLRARERRKEAPRVGSREFELFQLPGYSQAMHVTVRTSLCVWPARA